MPHHTQNHKHYKIRYNKILVRFSLRTTPKNALPTLSYNMDLNVGSLASGMIFGAGLTISGVASPQVIIQQFKLTDFRMLVTFLTASASSAATIAVYNSRSNDIKISPKQSTSLGWIGKYDGNVIGGTMIGLGMSLTGACPGTVLVQATANIGKSRLLACVSLLAGVIFVRLKQSNILHPSTSKQSNATVMSATGWPVSKTIMTYEAAVAGIVTVALVFAPQSAGPVHPVIGGLLIGLGQLSSILLVRRPVGVSSAYEDIGKLACDAMDGEKMSFLPDSVVFAAGLVAGTGLTMLTIPSTFDLLVGSGESSFLSIVVGGLVLILGARIAGGCTSGHGISGMAGMGLSSFITVASMFGTGILASSLTR